MIVVKIFAMTGYESYAYKLTYLILAIEKIASSLIKVNIGLSDKWYR